MQCAYTHYAHAVHVECTHCAHTRTECTHCAHIHAVHTNTLSTHTRSAYTHTECTHTVHTRSQSAHTHSLHMPSPAHSLPGPVCVCAWARAHPWHIVCTRAHPPTRTGTHTQHAAHPTLHVRAHTHTHTHTLLHTPSPSLQAPGVHTGTPTRAVFCTHALIPSVRIPQFACTTQPCVPRVAGHCCHRSHVARPLVHCNLVLQLTTLPLPINSNG